MDCGIIGAMERITSRQNAIVGRFRALARATARARSTEVLLDGAHLVQEALACDMPVEIAAFSAAHLAHSGPLEQLSEDVARQGARVFAVTPQVLAAMSPVRNPSGVVAIARARACEMAMAFAARADDQPLVLILAGLQDPGNVGAIIRAAAACGATGVIAIDGTANPFGWKALRGAMGGTFRLPIVPNGALADVIATARGQHVRVVAAVPRGGTPLPHLNLRVPSALLLGGEGAGIDEAALASADDRVTIPMRPPVESLNVAVAAAVILYEASRQRGA
jgi:RNA methyltransferase, TrmH family